MRTVVVAGLARCGSSLTMGMLASAGWPTIGEAPDFEEWDVQQMAESEPEAFAQRAVGHAVKLLDPQRLASMPRIEDAKVIFLRRDPREQARSQLKLINQFFASVPAGRNDVRRMAASIALDARPAMRACSEISDYPVLVLDFEDLIRRPTGSAARICTHLGINIETTEGAETALRMAAMVIQRPVTCLPYMLEAGLMI